MLKDLETPPLKDFFLMLGWGLLLGLGAVAAMKAVPALHNDSVGSLASDAIMLAIVYPLARRLGFSLRKTPDYLAALGAEFMRASKYFVLMAAALFAGYHLYAMALAPWDLAWTNKLLLWHEGGNNPAIADARIAGVLTNPWQLPLYFIGICVVPPIVEEFLLRRWLYVAMRRRLPAGAAIALNGAVFGLLHGKDFFMTGLPGVFFCWAYERTGKLETPILMHMLINFVNLSMIFGEKLGY